MNGQRIEDATPAHPAARAARRKVNISSTGKCCGPKGDNREKAMNQESTWETALEEAQVSFAQQSRDFDAAMSLATQASGLPIEVDERALRAIEESTKTLGIRAASPPINGLTGSRC